MQHLTVEPLEFEQPKRINYEDAFDRGSFENQFISCVLFATIGSNSNNVFTIKLRSYRNPFIRMQSNQTILTLSPSFGTKSETKLVWCHPIEASINDLRIKLTKLCGSKLEKIGFVY